MEGFVSIAAADILPLVEKGVNSIHSLRIENLEKEINRRLKVPCARTLLDCILRKPQSFPTREGVLEDLNRNTKYFGSRYNWIMDGYSDTMANLKTLRKASLLGDGDVLVCLEMAAFLQQFKENE